MRKVAQRRERAKAYRVPQTHRTHVCVWLIPIQAFAVAEGLGVCLELDVSFDANNRLELVRLQKGLADCSGTLDSNAYSAAEPMSAPG